MTAHTLTHTYCIHTNTHIHTHTSMLSHESQAEYTDIKTTARAAEIIKASDGAVFPRASSLLLVPPAEQFGHRRLFLRFVFLYV